MLQFRVIVFFLVVARPSVVGVVYHMRTKSAVTSSVMLSNNSDDLDEVGGGEALPAEVWASVMQYLPFETILSCAATSRMILRNAIPLLKTLHIDKATQMNLVIANRFRDVTEIYINCLLKVTIIPSEPGEVFYDAELDNESRMRVVPFISKFYKLERVIFRVQGEDGEVIKRFEIANAWFDEERDRYPDEGSRDKMLAFIDNISGSFHFGLMPKNLKILGLCCPQRPQLQHPSSCKTCLRACKSFPLESVLHFESQQSSTTHAISGRMHELDVCLNKSEIESVIESRPGGHELLCSDQRLLRLLGSGRHYEITVDDGEILHIVSYSDEQLAEIKRVIDYAELNVKEIPSLKITAAILRSFAKHNRVLLPPSNRRYLSQLSIEHLTSTIDLPIDAKDFEMPPANIIEHFMPKIGLILEDEDDDEDYSDEFYDIERHCLRLISDFLEVTDTLCQQIENVIPGLVQRLRDNQTKDCAVSSLMNIIVKGTPKQRNMIVGAGGITPLIQCLKSSTDSVVIAAVQALAKLATGRSKKHREMVLTTRTIPRFIELLDSDHDICVESSLNLLVTAAKSHVIGMCDKSLIPRLTRIMKSPSRLHMLPECSTLLVNVIDFGQPLIQDVIDAAILPRVIDIMSTNDDSTVQTNLAHVLIKLATSDQTGVIAKVDGLLSVLISLLDSSSDVTANASIVALGNIVQIAPEYRDLVVEAGVMKPLLHILNHSDKVGIVLKNVTETFSQCCQGKSTDFSATKASLNVLTRLIVDDDIDVLHHACWALFHLLDGLQNGDVRSVMRNPSFVKNILNHAIHLLQLSTFPLELPVLNTLYLITKADKAGGIDAIIRCEGIAAISKILSTDHEDHRILACKAMCNIISGSSDRLQAAIDCEMFPQMFNFLLKTQDKYALQIILEATGAANLVQSRYLVNSGCVKHLCTFLTTDIEALPCRLRQMRHCNTEIVALYSLKNLLATAKSVVGDRSGRRDGGHQNADDESDSDEHSSSDEDEDLIHEMIVQNCGTPEINGTYKRAGSHDGVSKFTKRCFYDGKDDEFSLFRCKLTDNTKRWYISIVPMNSHPGTSKDIDFYAAFTDGNRPPRHNWQLAVNSKGKSPTPEVYPITYDLLRSVEKRLQNFLHESNQREQTLDVIKLLQQKNAWLKVDACEKRIESFGNAVAILADLLQQADQQLHSLQTKRVKAEKHSPLNKVCDKLVEKQIESIAFMSNQLKEVNKEILEAKLSLERLATEAEEIAPKAEWCARLAKDDLPADLDDVNKALQISTSNLKSLDATRSSKKWHDRAHNLREGTEMLFQLMDGDSRKIQRDDDSLLDLDCQIVEKKRRLDSTIEKINADEFGEAVESVCTTGKSGCFIPSKVFAGSMKGYAFKTGSLGLGYYRDE